MAKKLSRETADPTEISIILPTVKIRKSTTFVLKPEDMEKGNPLSMTIPDQSMEMREIYKRYASGRPVDQSNREPLYYGEDVEVPDLKKLDLVEIAEMLEENRDRVDRLKQQFNEETELANRLEFEKNEKAKQQEDERLLKLYEERSRNGLNQK